MRAVRGNLRPPLQDDRDLHRGEKPLPLLVVSMARGLHSLDSQPYAKLLQENGRARGVGCWKLRRVSSVMGVCTLLPRKSSEKP